MMQVGGLAFVLAAIWLLLSGHYTPMFLAFGAFSVALVTALARRMDIVDDEGAPLPIGLRAPVYWAWLGLEILKSSLAVARRIWSARPAPNPEVLVTPTQGMSELAQVTYANSITLTPGTLSMSVQDGGIQVHALDATYGAELADGRMATRVRSMVP